MLTVAYVHTVNWYNLLSLVRSVNQSKIKIKYVDKVAQHRARLAGYCEW